MTIELARSIGGIHTYSEVRVAGHGTAQDIADLVATGTCKDEVVDDHLTVTSRSAGPDERQNIARQMADIARTSNDMKAVAGALKELNSLLPLDPALEYAIDKRMLALIAWGTVAKNAELAEAIALFIYGRAQERASVARPYIPTLLSFLAQKMDTTGAYAYYTLMIVAGDSPGHFGPYADMLVQALDSPGCAAKIFTMRIIAALAPGHPEYVAGARDALRNLAESGTHSVIKDEASRTDHAVMNSLNAQSGNSGRMHDDSDIASLYEMPVWQKAVECHLSTAYGSDNLAADRKNGRRRGIRRDSRPSKRSNRYQEFVEKLKQVEPAQSLEEPFALLSQEVPAESAPCGIALAEAAIPAPSPVAETPLPAEPVVMAPLAEDKLRDASEAVYLQEMMNEVQNDFSSRAGGLLDALGMGHMKRGTNEDGNHKISGKELVSALEKLVREKKSKAS
jgi:hypothetical protein